jgi:hypothetical protein
LAGDKKCFNLQHLAGSKTKFDFGFRTYWFYKTKSDLLSCNLQERKQDLVLAPASCKGTQPKLILLPALLPGIKTDLIQAPAMCRG